MYVRTYFSVYRIWYNGSFCVHGYEFWNDIVSWITTFFKKNLVGKLVFYENVGWDLAVTRTGLRKVR